MREAVLLVGGQGTRLRPLTLTTPKPLLPVAGVPFLTHQLAGLRRAGIGHVVLATSYQADVFTRVFGDGSELGLRITYLTEDQPLGTGGAIRHAASGLASEGDAPIVILNGDVLSGHDLSGQVEFHESSRADVTLHLVEVEDARAYGCVPTDDEGRVTAFLEKMDDPVTRWVNAGAYVFRRSVIDEIPPERVVSVERETFPGLLAKGRYVYAWKESAYWCDVGTPDALVRCSADIVLGHAPTAAEIRPPGEAWFADADRPPAGVVVGGGSSVAAGVDIGEGAWIDGSIVMTGAVIGPGAMIAQSVIGAEAQIGANARLDHAVVADRGVVAEGAHLATGERVEAAP
ncbi:MAG TPA: NDP-sugar synthase [Actinomycetes bacterium]|nr:NDP-sugar synthase [Actinomycetes bacterium]